MVAAMSGIWNRFMDLAKANKQSNDIGFLVKAYEYNPKFVSVFAKSNGAILSEEFDIPPTPDQMTVLSTYYDSIKVKVNKM